MKTISLLNPTSSYLNQLSTLASNVKIQPPTPPQGQPPIGQTNGINELISLIQSHMNIELNGTEITSLPIKLPLMSSYNSLVKQLETLENKIPGSLPDITFKNAFYSTQQLPPQLATLVNQIQTIIDNAPVPLPEATSNPAFDQVSTLVSSFTSTFNSGVANAKSAVNSAIALMDQFSFQSFLTQEQSPAVNTVLKDIVSLTESDKEQLQRQTLFLRNSIDGVFGTGLPESIMLNTAKSFAPPIPPFSATSMNTDLVAIRNQLIDQFEIVSKEEDRLKNEAVQWQRKYNFVQLGIQAQNNPEDLEIQQQFRDLVSRYEKEIYSEYRQVLSEKQNLEMEVSQAFMNTFLK